MSDIEAPARPAGRQSMTRVLYLAARLALGYIVAVAAGALLFSIVVSAFGDTFHVSPHGDVQGLFREIWQTSVVCFVFGGVFALPYTIAGALVFKFLLPQNWIVFMIVGMLCPTIAIMTLNVFIGGGASISNDLKQMSLASLPAGIAATYLFGAISFGLGFGRWRFA